MNILHVSSSFYPCLSAGGVVNASYQLSRKQAQNNNVAVITTDSCKKRLKFKNRYDVDVDKVKTYYFKNLSNSLKSSFLIDTPVLLPFKGNNIIKNYDILHIHEHRHSLDIVSSYYASKNNIPYIIQAHGSVLPFFQKEKLKEIFDKLWGFKILQNASKVFALTEIEKKQYLKMGISEENIEIVPLGINLEEYDNLPLKGNFRKKYGISGADNLILFVGRIHKIKGLDLLVKSFKSLTDNLKNDLIKDSDIKLVIVGPDDGFLDEILELIKKLNLEKKIILTGPLYGEDKKEAIVDCDIFVMPSQYESFTTSGLEAMACEKPLIVTKNNHIQNWVDNNVGYSVDYNQKDLANSIEKLLSDKEQKKKFGKKGRYLIEKKYNWDSIEKQIINIYKSLV